MPEDQTVPWYWRALDFAQLSRDYPPPPDFLDSVHRASPDEIRALQEKRFLQQMERAWQVPFYQHHWRKAGLEPGDIQSLEDIDRIPPYDVGDLRKSIERAPPFGDYMGIEPGEFPLVFHTSGGTTGIPRPMLYTPQDREVMNIIGGRRFYMQGIRPGDVVQATYSLGLTNGAAAPREALWKYTGAIPVITGSGAQTPTRRQIELAKAFGATSMLGFPAYLRHMALVARDEMKIDPRQLGLRSLGTHLGPEDRESLEELWGAPVYDAYGTNESGMMAADCEIRNGMHIFEDAYFLQIVDPGSNKPVERGNIFITCLFKHAAPVIRFNVNDVSSFATGSCPCGCTHRRLTRIFGRADNMVKLRGVNVFPEAIGSLVLEETRANGEYVCIVERIGAAERDEMTVMVETVDETVDRAIFESDLGQRFKEVLGVKMLVQAVAPGALDSLTGMRQTSKVRRLIDRRKM